MLPHYRAHARCQSRIHLLSSTNPLSYVARLPSVALVLKTVGGNIILPLLREACVLRTACSTKARSFQSQRRERHANDNHILLIHLRRIVIGEEKVV